MVMSDGDLSPDDRDAFEEGVHQRQRERLHRKALEAHLPKAGETDQEWSHRMNGHLRQRADLRKTGERVR
jgi:hypothetical protein